MTTWTSLDSGQDGSSALRSDRSLWVWGANVGGLGLGLDPSTTVVSSPTMVAMTGLVEVGADLFHGCALRDDGTLWCWGRNVEGQLGTGDSTDRSTPTQVGTESDWAHLAVGRFHTCAQKTDGRVYCTGSNDHGQLGIGASTRPYAMTLALP